MTALTINIGSVIDELPSIVHLEGKPIAFEVIMRFFREAKELRTESPTGFQEAYRAARSTWPLNIEDSHVPETHRWRYNPQAFVVVVPLLLFFFKEQERRVVARRENVERMNCSYEMHRELIRLELDTFT